MALPTYPSGSERTALQDAHLSLAEWQAFEALVKALYDNLGGLSGVTDLTETLTDILAALALNAEAVQKNLRVAPVPADWQTQVEIAADKLGIETAVVTNVSHVVDFTTTGALGLDTGTVAADEWYALWTGHDPDTGNTTSIASLSFTKAGLTLSGGLAAYTQWRFVGAQRTDDGGDLRPGLQVDDTFLYDVDAPATPVASGGNAIVANGTASTPTAVDASTLVPPVSRMGYFWVFLGAAGSTGAVALAPGDSVQSGDFGVRVASTQASGSADGAVWVALDDTQGLQYAVAGGGTAQIDVLGYRLPR
jgi:hypothetical protein